MLWDSKIVEWMNGKKPVVVLDCGVFRILLMAQVILWRSGVATRPAPRRARLSRRLFKSHIRYEDVLLSSTCMKCTFNHTYSTCKVLGASFIGGTPS